MSGQAHDDTHTADNCAECQRNKRAGIITVHYWEPIEKPQPKMSGLQGLLP